MAWMNRSYFKKVFWPNLFVGCSVQILEIQQYSSGLNLSPALTLNPMKDFETASSLLWTGRLRAGTCLRLVPEGRHLAQVGNQGWQVFNDEIDFISGVVHAQAEAD